MKPFKNYILSLLLLLVFTGSKAQIVYAEPFGTAGWDAANDIIIDSDSNYVMYGNHYKNLYIAKADTAAQLIWERSYPTDSILLYPSSICEIGDTSYIVSGKYQNVGFLLKVNTIGDSLFSLNDSTILGTNVGSLRAAPDGNLLAMVTFNGNGTSLVKLDNTLNVINTITNITPAIRGIEVVNNKIYILKQDSINNLLIISNDFTQIDTVTVPLSFPVYLKKSFNTTQLIIEGNNYGIRRMVYTDLLGNVNSMCDSVFSIYRTDFKPVNTQNDWVYVSSYNNGQWGYEIRLYFTDSCGQIVHDTILARWSFTIQPLDEYGVKLLVDYKGNYVIYARGAEGPLGDWDIFLWIYKQWDGFPTNIDEVENDKLITENSIVIYPNPTQNQFTILGVTENSSITVLDVMGKVVYHVPNTNSLPSADGLGVGQTQINTTNWAKGLYIVQIKGNQSSTTLKVIKQ